VPPGRLPGRDWLLLPLIAFGTLLLLIGAAEVGARIGWPAQIPNPCYTNSPERPAANCVAHVKTAEGPWVDERFNQCGYRGTGPCSPLPPGRTRIASIGTSTAWGFHIPFERSWIVVAADIVARRCGGPPPDVQSFGGLGTFNDVAKRLPEALALKPQLATFTISAFDIAQMPSGGFDPDPVWVKGQATLQAPSGIMDRAKWLLREARITTVIQAAMFRDPDRFVSTYLRYGDKADFVRPPFTPLWRARLAYTDAAIGHIAARLRANDIPLVIVFVPQQLQADIVGAGLRLPGIDPTAIDEAVRAMAERNGARFIDGTAIFRGKADAPDYFYRVDGHLNVDGNVLLGGLVGRTLAATSSAALCGGGVRR
jgi:hypothetical protein